MWNAFGRPAARFSRAGVASSHPVASQTAAKVLRRGGNAVDAAVAATAVLSVAQPMMCGIGGDVLALIWMNDAKAVVALNGSGRSPVLASRKDLLEQGYSEMPQTGPLSVTVPGAVAAWHDCAEKYGTLRLSDLLQDAIDHAASGLAVRSMTAWSWKRNEAKLAEAGGDAARVFLPSGRSPRPGDLVVLPDLASTLSVIASEGPLAVYGGSLGESMVRHVRRLGGWLTTDDLIRHRSEWVTPMSLDYRGFEVYQCPPNSQGVAALIALSIVADHDLSGVGRESPGWYELMIGAARAGLSVAFERVGDPGFARSIELRGYPIHAPAPRSAPVDSGTPKPDGDTAYVAVIDPELNSCSMISSLYHDFGSGLVVPGTGVVLNDRGALFSVDEESPNALSGGKRPYHTIMPAMVLRDRRPFCILGVVGGFQQPQAQLQILSRLIDGGLDPQQAIDSPRFRVDLPTSNTVFLEEGISTTVAQHLQSLGSLVRYVHGEERVAFGGAQAITRPETGVILGASDPRSDGAAAGW